MNCSYQRIICLLLLTAMVFIGSCEADVTSTRINLKEGLSDTLRILVSVMHLHYYFKTKNLDEM